MDFSVLSETFLPESILLIFPYAAQRSWLLQEDKVAPTKTTDKMITNTFFI